MSICAEKFLMVGTLKLMQQMLQTKIKRKKDLEK